MRFQETKPYEDRYWDRTRIERVRARVRSVDAPNKRLILAGRTPLPYDKLLVATGSRPNKFGWPGQDLKRVQGFYSLQDLARLEEHATGLRRAVIVGGGLIGIELAEMLHTRGVAVTFLVREPSYWNNVMPNAESALVNGLIREEGMDLRLKTELAGIVDNGRGEACAVTTLDGEEIECQLVGLTAGVSPNLSALEGSDIPTGRGVLVDRQFRTRVPDVYAAGDCAEIEEGEGQRNTIEQLWYTGKMHGEAAGRVMAGDPAAYDRGIWFNSAKFLSLEWQTYGDLTCGLSEDEPGRPHCLYWEHPAHRQALRISLKDGIVRGFNLMGIRYRHRVCERWIAEGQTIDYVLDHLDEANFDPEFFRRHEREIRGRFMEQLR
jgi:NADPH-dependent 2,4-dienoyl-CoA reductase/sulfur reductase-like enzyme